LRGRLNISLFARVADAMFDFDTIDDSLIIGSAFDEDDVPLLVELGVRAVVSLQAEAPDPLHLLDRHGIAAARIGFKDFHAPSLGQLEEAVGAVRRFVESDRRVYLHCYAGLQRAVTVAACYLIATDCTRWNARTALEDVTAKRRRACPMREQIDAVIDFDRLVRGMAGLT
jgi:predicted protein tyrosine phosphatase